MANFWVPLVDAPENTGVLRVIPGSHRWDTPGWGKVLQHTSVHGHSGIRPELMPEAETYEAVPCPISRGDVILLTDRTAHCSGANTSDVVRFSLDLRFCDARRPTGREHNPGFLARSAETPERVARSHEDWRSLYSGPELRDHLKEDGEGMPLAPMPEAARL